MKFNIMVRSAIYAATSLALGLGFVACSRDYVAAYVYVPSSASGSVSGYAVDSENGVITQISGSPFSSGLGNPSTLVASPNGKFIYVIGGSQNSEVVEFAIGTDGKLYASNTYNLPSSGTYPTAAAIDTTGNFLYVTYTYQLGYGPNSPGPGGVAIFPIDNVPSDAKYGTLSTPTSINVGNNPSAIAVSAPTCATNPLISTNTKCASGGAENVFVYVVDKETALGAPTVLGYAQNTTTGALTMLSGTTFSSSLNTYQGIRAGVTPSAIAIDPTGRYVYVTDQTSNDVIGYQIATTTTGNLTAMLNSPFTTGLYPVSVTIDPRGKYLYTANFNSSTVSSFSIVQADGSLGGTATVGNFSTATQPTCVTIEPALGIYLFTSNYLDSSISGGVLSPNTGQLSAIENTPFPTVSLPACIVSVPNGAHASSIVNP
jgi:6-phosphogluconolactonase (cycloisomerase 2 family)